MDTKVLDIFSLIGSTMSAMGVVIAIWQIGRTRRAADAAQRAAARTWEKIGNNLLLSDLTLCSATIDVIKDCIRSGRYESALLRVGDLMNQLNQIRHLPKQYQGDMNFNEILANLHFIRELLERRISDDSVRIDATRAIRYLSRMSDELNSWIGQAKFSNAKAVYHDS